jgi:hypothetical protein
MVEEGVALKVRLVLNAQEYAKGCGDTDGWGSAYR